MENNLKSNNLTLYIKKYWFQIIIVGFLLFVLKRKDFSFQFNMNNPNNVDYPSSQPVEKKQKHKELLTEKSANEPSKTSENGILERFGLSFIGGESSSKPKSEFPELDGKMIDAYIKRFAQLAVSERKKYGIPSSIILANALFHSFAGARDIAQTGNNHFAISCTSDWQGASNSYQNKCYRHYENAWTSFRDHSLFVTTGKYSNLLQFGPTDYKSWAKGLESEGFSEFDDLEKNLLDIIEKYELHRLDFQ